MKLPGIENLRVPTRFAMVTALPLAMMAALAFARLARRVRPRTQVGAAIACVALLVLDSWPRPIPMYAGPERYTLPAAAHGAAVVELPVGDVVDNDIAAMIRGMSHGRPVANGYTGHFPGPYNMLRNALRERDPAVLDGMASFGPLCLVIDRRLLLARNSRLMAEAAGASLVGTDRDYAFYMLEGRPRPTLDVSAAAPVATAMAQNWPTPVPAVVDGRLSTYWESLTRQRGSEGLTLELKETSRVSGIRIALGVRIGGYPRRLLIGTSEDGQTWRRAWEGPTAGLAYIAAVKDFPLTRFTIGFDPRAARFVRLQQTGAADAYWSVAEVEVLR